MDSIYNYSRNVYQKVKKELLNNPVVALLTLLFATLPLHHTLNSISTILFVCYSFWRFRKNQFVVNKTLLLPVLLCVLMGFSILWSINPHKSLDAFTKEIPLLLIPLCFMILQISKAEIQKILHNYSIVFFIFTVFYLLRALVKFLVYKDTNVFFYHELVSLDLNAIHVSVYCVIAFFIFVVKPNKNIID
jgi:O-antigen ligase